MTTSQELTELFEKFKTLKVLIIGDVMLDHYLIGSVKRISPEAPVPIVEITSKLSKLGGAANVALNVKSLGATPLLFSVIGNDEKGKNFLNKLEQRNINKQGILTDDNRPTTVKNRVISNNQQLLRYDEETIEKLTKTKEQSLIDSIVRCIENQSPSVIIFEDYDKGIISNNLITQIVKTAQKKDIPTVVDPKKDNFNFYKNVTLFKPNLRELEEGLNIKIDKNTPNEIKNAVDELRNLLDFKKALITLSENGVLFDDETESFQVAAHLRNISDVSGAGDTVVSVAALCLAANASSKLIAEISNVAGGLVCEKSGVVPIELMELEKECQKLLC